MREVSIDPSEAEVGESDDEMVDVGASGTLRERMLEAVALLRNLADGLEYQVQFNDHRMLDVVERDTAGALRLARNVQIKERSFNSSRGAVPRTWDSSAYNVMFYRPRPSRA